MSLQSIATTLNGQATSTGTVTINDALLATGNTAFATLVSTQLLRPAGNIMLNASSVPIPPTSASSFSFNCTMPTAAANSFLNLNANTATATISLVGTVYQLQLSIQLTSGATPNWVMSTSFSDMLGWPFDSLPVTSPQFLFIYGTVSLPAGTAEGLNYSATPSLTGMLAPAAVFLTLFGYTSPPMTALTGSISQTANGTAFLLRSSFTSVTNLDLVALTINNLNVSAIFGYTTPPSGSGLQPEGWGQIVLMAETTLSGASDPIDVSLVLPYTNSSPFLSLVIAPPPGSLATSLNNLGEWMAGDTWDSFFTGTPASVLLPFLTTFGLRSYTLTFGLSGTSFLPTSVMSSTLSVGTLTPWDINPPNLIMQEFFVTWQLIDPFGAAFSAISINGELDMFNGGANEVKFTGSILLPELQLSLALASEKQMTAADWLTTIVVAFGGSTPPTYILDALSGFSLETIVFSMDVPNEDFTYQMAGGFLVGDNNVDFSLYVHINIKTTFTYDLKTEFNFASVAVMGEIKNDSSTNNQTVITGTWRDATNPLQLNNIAISLGFGDLGIPPALDMALKFVGLTYNLDTSTFIIGAESLNYGNADLVVFKPAGAPKFIFFGGLVVDKPIDLTNLPLVGQALAKLQTVEIRDLQIQITSDVITPAQATTLNALITALDPSLPVIPAQGMASTVNISMNFDIAGFIIPIGTGLGGQSASAGMPPNKSSVQGTPSGNTNAPVPSSPGSQSDGTSWFNLQKAVGPVMFRRIGIRYKDSVLWFVLDASFSAGGLTIDLLGAGIGSPLTTFEPQFTVDGLGLDFSEPGFELGGTFMKVPPSAGVDWEYAGGAVIKAGNFAISAYGSYASMDGTPSMFVFGQVTGTFGGPPVFFVTGFAGGFGYNSSLRLPAVNEIYQFPLVGGAQNPAVIGGSSPKPAEVLAILLGLNGGTAWVTHEIGQYWFAAGIQFTTYSIVNTNALLVIEFGKRLQFALLGLSRARFPMAGPVTYAFVELQIEVLVDPSVGVFALSAMLSPNSYVLDPSCKLTGGFAFYYWFDPNLHAGDFVITIGGYHPNFNPPSWYPSVPRVGFSWSLDSTISITGGAYFAMTPSAAMAGGSLSATYQSGNLRAWFTAWADMLIYWNPFQFDIYIGISVGASYTIDWGFTTSTLEVEMGASLHLWGPPTGGTVTVHWWVISFTIDFGQPQPTPVADLTWTEFQAQLPANNSIVKIVPDNGLAPNGATDLNSGTNWVARPSGFSFTTSSAIPSSSLLLGSSNKVIATGTNINIRPMQVTNLTSTQQIIIKRDGTEINYTTENWTVTQRQQNIAKAMWGTGPQNQMDPGDDQLVDNQLMGFAVQSPTPSQGNSPGEINVAVNLPYNLLSPVGVLAIQPGTSPQGPIAQNSTQTIQLIETEISDLTYASARTTMYNALIAIGVDPLTNGDMTVFAATAGSLFADEPLLIPAS